MSFVVKMYLTRKGAHTWRWQHPWLCPSRYYIQSWNYLEPPPPHPLHHLRHCCCFHCGCYCYLVQLLPCCRIFLQLTCRAGQSALVIKNLKFETNSKFARLPAQISNNVFRIYWKFHTSKSIITIFLYLRGGSDTFINSLMVLILILCYEE